MVDGVGVGVGSAMRARPSTEMHSTVSSTVTTHWGLAAMFRALRALGEHENQNRSVAESQTPHTGMACGRADAEAVTTQ